MKTDFPPTPSPSVPYLASGDPLAIVILHRSDATQQRRSLLLKAFNDGPTS
jgi:hypothetical protein